MGRAADIEAILAALDPILVHHGFRRRKKAQVWTRTKDSLNRDLIHINFGLTILNPSIAVEYLDLAGIVPQELGSCLASEMLTTLIPRHSHYGFDTPVVELASDIAEFGIPFLEELHNRDFVIQRLSSESPSDWCVPSYSERIRLLPLMLATVGRTAEATTLVQHVLPEAVARDQRVPRYDEFAAWFLTEFAVQR